MLRTTLLALALALGTGAPYFGSFWDVVLKAGGSYGPNGATTEARSGADPDGATTEAGNHLDPNG